MIIRSANDVAVAVAEAVGGNQGVFVVMMNANQNLSNDDIVGGEGKSDRTLEHEKHHSELENLAC